MRPRFPFVAADVSEGRVDELSALLFELGSSGVEQRDPETHPARDDRLPLVAPKSGTEAAAWPELPVPWRDHGSASGQLAPCRASSGATDLVAGLPAKVTLLASFDSRALAEAALGELAQLEPDIAWRRGEFVGDEWRERYKLAFSSFLLTRSIRIVPPWTAPAPGATPEHQRILWLDPGRAFGTGLHASTALVAEILEDRAIDLNGTSVLDVGTGSGILALVALMLGARRAVGIDVDADALEVARANAERNGVAERLAISPTALSELPGTFPWVLANIELRVLCELGAALGRHVGEGGRLVLSGLLEPQRAEVLACFLGRSDLGLELEDSRQRTAEQDSWLALVLRRPAQGRAT